MTRPTNIRGSIAIALALLAAGCSTSAPAANDGPVAAVTAAAPAATPTAASTEPSVAPPASSVGAASPTSAATPAPIVVAAKSPETALKQLWQVGGPKPPKDGGCCPVIAPDGKIWVSSEYDASFWIIERNGKYLESWGAPGSGEGQFNFVGTGGAYGDIAFDPDGTFYVADTGNHRIQKFDKNRHFVKAWGSFGTDPGQFATPGWIASDGRGHVWVSDSDRLDVQEFTSDGTYLRTIAVANALFIATDPEGVLYADDGTMILAFDAEGHQLPGFDFSSTGALAAGMAFDTAGHVYVALVSSYNTPITTEGIYELDTTGKVLHAWPGDADSLALDPNGDAIYTSFFAEPFIRKLALPKP